MRISKAQIVKFAEQEAIGQYLSDDAGLSYDRIISLLHDNKAVENDIIIWQPFEYRDEYEVASLIENFKRNMIFDLTVLLKGK